MDKSEVLTKIEQSGIIPVIRTNSEAQAEEQVKAILAGGIAVFEITMSVSNAPQLIEKLSNHFGDVITLGAGTVLRKQQAEACLAAGAKFIVSPILDTETVEFCLQNEVAVFPAGLTPNEIFKAAETGADGVKIFPANSMGGASYLKSIKAVFPAVKLMPTGGVNLETIADFFRAGAFAVGIGSELTSGTTDEISEKTRKFAGELKVFRQSRNIHPK